MRLSPKWLPKSTPEVKTHLGLYARKALVVYTEFMWNSEDSFKKCIPARDQTQVTAVATQLLQSWDKEEIPKDFNEFLVVENPTFGRKDMIVFPGHAGLLSDSDECFVRCGKAFPAALQCEL